MTAQLSPGVRRIVALGLLIGVVLIGWALVVDPLLGGYRDAETTIQRLRPAIERAEADGAGLAELQVKVEQLKSRKTDGAGLLAGATESIAAAELQSRLKKIADAAKADLKSTQTMEAHDEGSFRRIAVRGEISGTLASVQQILYAVETNTPYLFLDDVDIRVIAGAAGAEATKRELELLIDVSGYMRRPA